jgi:xylulokinase
MVDAARIAPHQLPPILAAQSLAGTLTREPAAALGVPAGIPVAVGAGDDVECLGAGLLHAGAALEHLGTTGSILACCEHVVVDPSMRVDCYPHAVPGLYLVGGSTGSAGATLAWAARHLAMDRDGAVGDDAGTLWLGEELLLDDEDLIIFLPYLAGERCPVWDPAARGILIGMTLHTTRRHIAQAIFAGVAFSLRHILDTLLELGLRIEEVVASGDDGAWSGTWPVLRSTVYNRPLLRPATGDATAVGALILTLVAAGAAPDIASAAARVIRPPARRIAPAAEYRRALERRYGLYRDLSASAVPLFNRWNP